MVDTVVVAISVSSCFECPNYYDDWGEIKKYCFSADRELEEKGGYEVPSWCPFRNPDYANARI